MKVFLLRSFIVVIVAGIFTYGLYSAAESKKHVQQQIEESINADTLPQYDNLTDY